MVELGDSSNVMPLKFHGKINIEPEPSNIQIIQFDRTKVKVIRELKKVFIRMSSNQKFHQMIDIMVVDVLDNYGMLLSRDWSTMLNEYFATELSHLWLPYNGKMNQIRVDIEKFMKHVVTNSNDSNELVMFNHSILGNYSHETFIGNFTAEPLSLAESDTQSEILHFTHSIEPNCNIYDQTNNSFNVQTSIVSRDKLEKHTDSINLIKTEKSENSKIPIETKKEILTCGRYFLMDPSIWKVKAWVSY
jgi:hypothetical protein